MFDRERLTKIITESTIQYRKGEPVTTKTVGNITVHDVYMMPHTSEAEKGLELVDMWFINVGVKRIEAEKHREELVAILNEWPDDPLSGGLSYISFGGTLGSQDLALMLMALGKFLGFWKVVTPAMFGDIGEEKANELAGRGFIMASGYNPVHSDSDRSQVAETEGSGGGGN